QIQQKRHASHHKHKYDKNSLFSGPRYEAVNSVGAGPTSTLVQGPQLEPIKKILAQNETHLKQSLENNVEHIGAQQCTSDTDFAMFIPDWRLLLLSTSPSITAISIKEFFLLFLSLY
ncbi:MAG: hypothetical protein AAFR30_03320, partial [Cyanobacteria bacterium J06628_4]